MMSEGSEAKSHRSKPLASGIHGSLKVGRVRLELNCKIPSWCPKNCLLVWGKTNTLELGAGSKRSPPQVPPLEIYSFSAHQMISGSGQPGAISGQQVQEPWGVTAPGQDTKAK